MIRRPLLLLGLFCAIFPALAQTAAPPNPEAPLTLNAARELAWRNHGDLGAARIGVLAAQNRVTAAKSARAPQVAGSIATDYQNGQIVTLPGAANTTTTTFSTGVSLSQTLFDSGRIKYQVRGARANAVDAAAGVGTARNSLAFEVAQGFFEQLRGETLVAQRVTQIQVALEQLNQIEAQIAAGASPKSDLTGARVTLSQARFDLATAQTNLRTAQTRLRNALGLQRGPALKIVAPDGDETAVPTLETALETAQSQRPDLLSARALIAQNRANVRAVKINERPSIAANLGFNLDPRATDERRFQLGATLSLPIFNGKGRRADTNAARQDLQSAQIRFDQLQRDAQSEVETALLDLEGQQTRVQNARALVEAAQQNLETATGRYQAGIGIALDVTTAQSQLFEAQTSLTGAQFDLRISREALQRAQGNFAWENGVAPTIPPELR